MALLACLALFPACSDDTGPSDDPSEVGPDLTRRRDANVGADAAVDPGAPDADAVEEATDEPDPICDDVDGDQFTDAACGGRDCDDQDALRNPGVPEFCDYLDNDCNGRVNDGIECMFFAHTDTRLVRIDPFRGVSEVVGDSPGLWDIDTHPDGTLYGVSPTALYEFNDANSEWERRWDVDLPGDTNGMAIDQSGRALFTSGNVLSEMNLETGDTNIIGEMGDDFESSGDCVVNKDNTLFMSSRSDGSTDELITINGETGRGRFIGDTGFDNIYALTSAWGILFGLTSSGQVIDIDEQTGEGEIVGSFPSFRFFGAASTPGR